jgi:DinB family protein
MQYLKLTNVQRDELMRSLGTMHAFLRDTFATLSADEARRPGPNGGFSPVEQVWHLADLEREGFGLRIQRLLSEANPVLPDFDGARIARERDYRSLDLLAGLAAFEAARRSNIATLRAAPSDAWSRGGTLEGVGPVSLCDMPAFLQQHDQAHVAEIHEWQEDSLQART